MEIYEKSGSSPRRISLSSYLLSSKKLTLRAALPLMLPVWHSGGPVQQPAIRRDNVPVRVIWQVDLPIFTVRWMRNELVGPRVCGENAMAHA